MIPPKKLTKEDIPELVGLATYLSPRERRVWDEQNLEEYLINAQNKLEDIWYIVTPGILWIGSISQLAGIPPETIKQEIQHYFYP